VTVHNEYHVIGNQSGSRLVALRFTPCANTSRRTNTHRQIMNPLHAPVYTRTKPHRGPRLRTGAVLSLEELSFETIPTRVVVTNAGKRALPGAEISVEFWDEGSPESQRTGHDENFLALYESAHLDCGEPSPPSDPKLTDLKWAEHYEASLDTKGRRRGTGVFIAPSQEGQYNIRLVGDNKRRLVELAQDSVLVESRQTRKTVSPSSVLEFATPGPSPVPPPPASRFEEGRRGWNTKSVYLQPLELMTNL
jgi:hypothetical protein